MIRLFQTEMPSAFDGVAVKYGRKKSEYMILINENLCMQKKVRAFRHELLHIINNDFESVERGVSVEEVEHINRARVRKLYNE